MGILFSFKSTTVRWRKSFEWNGVNMQGEVLPGRYTYTLKAEDKAGNFKEVTTAPFELVTEKAELKTRLNRLAFSPNGDGKADTIVFFFDSNKKDSILKQTLTLFDSKDEVIKEVVRKGFVSTLKWDGKASDGKAVEEGKYSYSARYEFKSGETPTSVRRNFYVDLSPIEIELSLQKTIFSPNGDGINDYLIVDQIKQKSAINDSLDKITLTLLDDKKKVYKSAEWIGELPSGVKWGGLRDSGEATSEGDTYWYVLSTEDSAGNEKVYRSKRFRLIRQKSLLTLKVSSHRLTYNKTPKSINRLSITASVTNSSGIQDSILGLEYALVSLKEGSSGKRERHSLHRQENRIPLPLAAFDWDGRMLTGERLPNGRYTLEGALDYESGNRSIDRRQTLILDSEGPEIAIRSQPAYFSPDGDGVDERLQVRVTVRDEDEIALSEVFIYRKIFMRDQKLFRQSFGNYKANVSKPFMRWSLKNASNRLIEWDGKASTGNRMVESANDYWVYVESYDMAGNRSVEGRLIQVDVLVEKLSDGRLRIILNSLNFVFDSTQLIGDYKKTLYRLVYILYKFPKYKIDIIGHTDEQGEDDYNQVLSQKRAQVVHRYLRREGIEKERLSWQGRGESELLPLPDDMEIEERHRQNRRVELYLDKSPEGAP